MAKRVLGPGASCCNEFGCELCTPDAFQAPVPTPEPVADEGLEIVVADEDGFDFDDEEDES